MLQYMLMPLKRYAQFQGRSRRKEYWLYTLFLVIVSVILGVIDFAILSSGSGVGFLGLLFSLATLLPSLAVSVRRLHDTNRSGWWILIALIPLIGAIVLIVFTVQDSTPGANRFGPSPKSGDENTAEVFA